MTDGRRPRARSRAALEAAPAAPAAEEAAPRELAAQVAAVDGRPPRKRPRAAARPDDVPPVVADEGSSASGPSPRARRPAGRKRARESGIAGLGQRARLQADARHFMQVADPLLVSVAAVRHTLLNRPFEAALSDIAVELASALAPAVVQFWIPDASPLAGDQGHIGGQELTPTLALRASAVVPAPAGDEAGGRAPETSAGSSAVEHRPAGANPFVEEVAAARHPVALYAGDAVQLGAALSRLLAPAAAQDGGAEAAPLGTLVGYPLRTRGQFLGVLMVGAAERLGARHLTLLEELADIAALAADRERQLSYSRSQEALAQTVVRQAPVAIAVLAGPDHVFALANPTFCLLLGVDSAAHLTGRSLHAVVGERATRLAASLRLDAVLAGGEPQVMLELPLRHTERGMTYWNVSCTPAQTLPEGGAGVLVTAVEVTRQVVARQRSQEIAEVAQERIAQMMTLHATSLDVAGQLGADPRELLADILRRSIALLNARAGAVYVRTPHRDELEVIVAQGLRGAYVGSRIAVGAGLAGRVAETGQGFYVDDYRAFAGRAAIYDDEDFTAVIAVPLIQRGQVLGVLDVLDDAERRAFTDDDLWLLELFAAQAAQAIENARTYVELERAYRKQRDLDRMKDDFIATASHELRTPLTGVQGFIDLLLDFPGSRDDPLALDFLQKASDSAQELAEISERLLQTSRLDSGRVELHRVRVRLAQVVEETLRSLHALQQAQGSRHVLLAEIPPDLYIWADLGRLKAVLENLIGNAIKYSPQGGHVVVSCAPATFGAAEYTQPAERIEERPTEILPLLSSAADDPAENPCAPRPTVLTAAAQRRYLVVTIRDEGMGIQAAEYPRLFGRFARTEAARASQIRGTGLGLYICRQIVRAMDGDVWLEASTPGGGSTFAFALPEAQPESSRQGERAGAWAEI